MLATLIGDAAQLVAAIGNLVAVIVVYRKLRHEVKTSNGQTLAALSDAIETRRIEDIPPRSRTDAEDEHIEQIEEP